MILWLVTFSFAASLGDIFICRSHFAIFLLDLNFSKCYNQKVMKIIPERGGCNMSKLTLVIET